MRVNENSPTDEVSCDGRGQVWGRIGPNKFAKVIVSDYYSVAVRVTVAITGHPARVLRAAISSYEKAQSRTS